MTPGLVRALQSLHDRAETMDTASKNGNRKLRSFNEEFDVRSYLQYYRDVLPSLHHLNTFNSEYVDQLINEYAENAANLDKRLQGGRRLFILEWFDIDESVVELHYILNNISNNTGNLLYQIKINEE